MAGFADLATRIGATPTAPRFAATGPAPSFASLASAISSGASASPYRVSAPAPGTAAGPPAKAPSLLEQFGRALAAIPAGLAQTAVGAVETAGFVPHLLYDVATQNLPKSGFGGYMERYLPLPTAMGEGAAQTAADVANPARYGEASRQGTIVSKIINDIGTAGMALAGAGAAVGAPLAAGGEAATEAAAGETAAAGGAQAAAAEGALTGGAAAREALANVATEAPAAAAPAAYRGLGYGWLGPRTAESGRLGYSLAQSLAETNPELAAQVGRVGQALTRTSQGLNLATGMPLPIEGLRLAGRGVGLLPGVPPLGEWMPRTMDYIRQGGVNPVTGEPGRLAFLAQPQFMQRLADRRSEEGQRFAAYYDQAQRGMLQASRNEMEPLLYAQDLGLTPAEQRVVTMATAERGRAPADAYNAALAAPNAQTPNLNEMVRQMYEGVNEDQRPVPEDIRNYADYLGGRMDPGRAALIDQAVEHLRDSSLRMTAAKVASGELPLAQAANEPMPNVLTGYRLPLEAERNTIQQAWTKAHNDAIVKARIANAWDAVRAELPTAPTPAQMYARGRQSGLRDAGAQAAAEQARVAQTQLERSLADYVNDVETGRDQAAVTARAAEVDRLTAQVRGLADIATMRERRLQAAGALSRAGSEVIPGEPYGRPDIGTGQAPSPAELRAAQRAHSANVVEELHSELDRITGNERIALTPRARFAGQAGAGEYDWPTNVGLSNSERLRMTREGYIASEPGKVGNDVLAENMSRTLGRDVSTDEAAALYMQYVRAIWDAQAGRSQSAIQRVANETGLAPDAVEAALRGTRADYRNQITTSANTGFDAFQAEYNSLPQEERNLFVQVFNQLRADPQAVPQDYHDLLSTWLPQSFAGGLDSQAARLMPFAHEADVAQSLIGGRRPDVVRTFTEARTAAGQRQIGAMTAEVQGARKALVAGRRELAQARSNLARAIRENRADLAATRARFDRAQANVARLADTARIAQRRADANYAFGPPSLAEVQAGRTWQRFRGAPSAGERTAFQAGRRAEAARAADARASQTRRSLDRLNEKIANIPNEFARRWQDRFGDVNDKAVTSLENAVKRAGPELGALELRPMGRGAYGERLTGELARHADAYDIRTELSDVLRATEERAGVPLSAHARGELLTAMLRDRGIELPDLDKQRLADAVARGTLLEHINDIRDYDKAANVTSNTPRRVISVIRDTGQWMPQEIRNATEAVTSRYEAQRANFLHEILDNTAKAAPARWRDLILDAHREIRTLYDMADKADRTIGPQAGDHLRAYAEDVPNTIEEFMRAGIEPSYLIGGKAAPRIYSGPYRPGAPAATRAGKMRQTGLGPVALADIARTNADEAARMFHNKMLAEFANQFGRRADKVIGETMRAREEASGERMTPEQMTAAAATQGYVPHGTESTVGPQTILVPKWMKDQIDQAQYPNGMFWRGLRSVNRGYKVLALPLSPKWLVHRSIGNVLQAVVHGGISPMRLFSEMRDMTKEAGGLRALYRRGGVPDSTPSDILRHGLTRAEFNSMYPRDRPTGPGPVGQLITKSFNLNTFMENMTRSAMYRAKLHEGIPSEAAVRATGRALGAHGNLTPVEAKLAQALPFYPWLRHQTTAMLRLPIENPMRTIYLAQLANEMVDPNLDTKQLIALGSNIPLPGGQFLGMGNISPLANPMALPLSPLEIGRSLSPAIKLPIEALLGVNPDRSFMPLSRPADTARTDVFGKALPTAPLFRGLAGIPELAYLAAGQMPYVRTARDILLNPSIAHYATGYVATKGGERIPTGRTRLGALWAGLNLPSIRPLPQLVAAGTPTLQGGA
jgi:hypothetical protein